MVIQKCSKSAPPLTQAVVRNQFGRPTMIDKSKLPEQTYNELIDLLGYEGAEQYLDKNGYHFPSIQLKILTEQMKRRYGKRIWIYIWIVGLILAIIITILSNAVII
jgi:hypothetical protein